jgi:tetratricopeptide (TPR) repeat protein
MVLEGWDEDAYSALMARIAEHPASSCYAWSSLALWALGRTDESLAHAERAVELGEQNPYALSTAIQQRAMLHQLRHDIDECIEWAERCHAIGVEQSYPMRLIQADIYKGWAYGASGRPDEGAELIANGLARFRHEGATLNEAYYLGMYADALLHSGEPAAAREALSEAVARTTSRNYFYEVELARLTAWAHAADGEAGAVGTVRGEFDRARQIAIRQGSPTFELRVLNDRWEFEIDHGDPQPWREAALSALTPLADQQPNPDTRRTEALAER